MAPRGAAVRPRLGALGRARLAPPGVPRHARDDHRAARSRQGGLEEGGGGREGGAHRRQANETSPASPPASPRAVDRGGAQLAEARGAAEGARQGTPGCAAVMASPFTSPLAAVEQAAYENYLRARGEVLR